MRTAPEILNVFEAAKLGSAESFFIYKPTWDLIISALDWSLGKTAEEIQTRISKGIDKQIQSPKILWKQWQLMIDSLRWIIEETDTDPLESRRNLIPLAK